MEEPQEDQRCEYENQITAWHCHRPILPDSKEGFCICHERRDYKNKSLFENEIDEILKKAGEEDCHFDGFYFPYSINFRKFAFKKNVYFVDAEFKASAGFSEAQFSGEIVDFTRAKFWGFTTRFRKVQFSGEETRFYGAQFSAKLTQFDGAQFKAKETDFEAAQFRGDAVRFYGVHFSGIETKFNEAQFLGNAAIFDSAQFGGEMTIFKSARFSGEIISFFKTIFASETTAFQWAQFLSKTTSFSHSIFSGQRISFGTAQFSGDLANFSFSKVYGLLDLTEVNFECKDNGLRNLALDSQAKLIFNGTVFREKNYNDLSKIDLSKCLLRETFLDYCDLSMARVDWKLRLLNESLSEKDYREIIRDDAENKSHRFAQAASSYRTLKINFEAEKDYPKADICHYRERECIRQSMSWKKPNYLYPLIATWLLKISSAYGERPRNVLLSSGVFLIFFPIVFAIPGFQLCPSVEGLSASEAISSWGDHSVLTHLWWGFKHTLFNFFPLWRLDDIKACTDPARLATGFIALVGAFMIGMFIYVFRRRLMR
jgi:uncharacterized protein YjbI with pentapeptide repeats